MSAKRKRRIIKPKGPIPYGALDVHDALAWALRATADVEQQQVAILNVERKAKGFPDTKQGWVKYALWARQQKRPLSRLAVKYEAPGQTPHTHEMKVWANTTRARQDHGFKTDKEALVHLYGPVFTIKDVDRLKIDGEGWTLGALQTMLSRVRSYVRDVCSPRNQGDPMTEAQLIDSYAEPDW